MLSYAYYVGTSHGKQITDDSRGARFFLEPVNPLHRQYEALRAYFIEGLPSAEAARRFGYTPGAFRVLCHQFRRTQDLQERFFGVCAGYVQKVITRGLNNITSIVPIRPGRAPPTR